jgi:hypothetical protein
MFHRYDFFRVSACQIQACTVMTGLLAGPLTDAAGLDAVRADLAGVVQQVLGPARVSLRISHCDRDWLNRDRRWRERSHVDRGFDRQPAQAPDVFAVACRTGVTVYRRGRGGFGVSADSQPPRVERRFSAN